MHLLDTLMPSYKSNVQDVIGNLKKQLEGINGPVMNKITRTIATTLVASNVRRVHNNGQAVDMSQIGDYKNKEYKEIRIKKGKRVDRVNLDFTGKLSKEFSLEADAQGIGVGFLTSYGGNLQENLEEKYKKKIWGVTQDDERVSQDIAIGEIKKAFNG